MTRARMPRPHEVAAARRDPRLLRAVRERQDDGAWRTRGACQAVDPETFFPAPSEPADAAVALCRTCEVQGACLAWALEVGDCHGVWGATTPRERRAMLVAWRSEVHGIIPLDPSAGPVRSQVELTSLASLLAINRLPDPVGVS
jgi:WhiB family redox-sensing transcriptional regulator